MLLASALAPARCAASSPVGDGWTPRRRAAARSWRATRAWPERRICARSTRRCARATSSLRHVGGCSLGLLSGGVLIGSWVYGIVLAVVLRLPAGDLDASASDQAAQARSRSSSTSTLQSIANTILVTQNLEDAFATIAQHFDPPISQEADIAGQAGAARHADGRGAARPGAALPERATSTPSSPRSPSGAQTGGELPKVLETTAGVLRETMRVEGVMEAKTSEGKAQVRGHGHAAVRLRRRAAGRSTPEWMEPLFHDPIGWARPHRSPACSSWSAADGAQADDDRRVT